MNPVGAWFMSMGTAAITVGALEAGIEVPAGVVLGGGFLFMFFGTILGSGSE